jgi:hypothetical protein
VCAVNNDSWLLSQKMREWLVGNTALPGGRKHPAFVTLATSVAESLAPTIIAGASLRKRRPGALGSALRRRGYRVHKCRSPLTSSVDPLRSRGVEHSGNTGPAGRRRGDLRAISALIARGGIVRLSSTRRGDPPGNLGVQQRDS